MLTHTRKLLTLLLILCALPALRAALPEGLEEVLAITITDIADRGTVEGSDGSRASMLGFGGHTESPIFTGTVLPGAYDCQKSRGGVFTLSARYTLEGTDSAGQKCHIFIENNAVGGSPLSHPTVVTDSKALAWLNSTPLTGYLDNSDGALTVRLCKSGAAPAALPKLPGSRPSVSILGDSYSTFENCMSPDSNYVWYFRTANPKLTDVDRAEQTWWHRLLADTGMKLELNNSFSGSTISTHGYNGEDYSDRAFFNRVDHLGAPDIILVFGATNDSWAGAQVGTYPPEGPLDPKTLDLDKFRPATAWMMQRMAELHPGTPVYFIVNTGLRPEITESILTLCRRYGVTPIVLTDIDKKAGHPTVLGMEQIASQVKAAISR